MALYLVTGQPGHGKTAYAIDKAFAFKKEGREIYAHGIKDFDYERAGWKHLEDPTKWQDCPDGAVIILDECYTVFPNRNPGAKVPEHVEPMARHRHRGFDFILIAQQGLQLDPFLRGLYEEHCHVRQTSIMKSKTKLKKWDAYQGNVAGPCGNIVDWVRPKYVFDYYTSTTLVTTKRSIPTWVKMVGIGLLIILTAMYYLKHSYSAKIEKINEEAATTHSGTGVTGASAKGAPGPRTYDTPTDYAKAHVARFATMPWTAPIYDGGSPAGQPQLYCMSSLAGTDAMGKHQEASCSCMTEQGTKYEMSQPECRTVARNSTPYNPYKQPVAPPPPYVPPADQVHDQVAAVPGTVIGSTSRAAGTFPESKPYQTSTTIPDTTAQL
ncbi:zonular occludens toxin [Xanthomonas sp. MLO165]|uniref:zonular occludens toxin domain-containing protein n=1 Tax=Xanthomonas sp. MLO165 TaxID=2081477 RepID=UPI001C05C063|nr:zonular occludens toxin domain-containing protein [Xanthomonas sp. MLO165]QWM99712.1 zonular occludens toxin [Xanthomonas sp. MLO165]